MRRAYDLEPAFRDLLSTLRAREGNGPPLFSPGERIVAAARRFARTAEECARFATGTRLFSVNPAIAPLEPGEPKDVLFVGDVLHAGGFVAPVEGVRYWPAERWPASALFQPIGAAWARSGDLLVLDRHIEVITAVSERWSRLLTLGAHRDGLCEDYRHLRVLRGRPRGERLFGERATPQVLRVTVQGP